MNQKKLSALLTILGLLLIAAGLILVKTTADPQGILRTLPYISIGLGCGIFGHGMGDIISRKATKNNPAFAKQIEIEKNDERNVAIGNRAKAKSYDMMVFVYGALMLAFTLMGADFTVIILFVAAYLFVIGYGVYYRCKYDKEM